MNDPIIADYSKVRNIAYKSKVEVDDLFVENLTKSAMVDADYFGIIQQKVIFTSPITHIILQLALFNRVNEMIKKGNNF